MVGVEADQTRGLTVGGQTFRPASTGPTVDKFDQLGGPYKAAWDNVADQLQSTDRGRIIDEINRQFREQHATPADAAAAIQDAATRPMFRSSQITVHTDEIAAHVAALARTNPAHARAVEAEILGRLGAGDASRFIQDLGTIADQSVRADARLANAPPARALVVERGQLSEQAIKATSDRFLSDATVMAGGRVPRGSTTVDTAALAYSVEKLAETDPSLARAVRADLSLRLAPTDAVTLDRLLAGDTHFGETMVMSARHPADAAIGAIKGTVNGVIGLGDLIARGSTLQNAAEIDNAAMMQASLGSHRGVEQAERLGKGLHDLGSRPMIDQIPYSNVAQAGGADIAIIADAAMAAKGLVTAGARLAVRGGANAAAAADEAAEVTTATGKAEINAARQLDKFDEIARGMKIDMTHILEGEINKKGAAVGFHSRPGGVDPAGSRMVAQLEPVNTKGVYTGKVEVLNADTGSWVSKNGSSSFFPDKMSKTEIEQAVRDAYADALRNNNVDVRGKFEGESGHGFRIEGYARDGVIPTAYPLYR